MTDPMLEEQPVALSNRRREPELSPPSGYARVTSNTETECWAAVE